MAQRVAGLLASVDDGAYPRMADVAARCGISSRTLIRRLHEDGATFQQLLDAARKQRALWMLLHTAEPVEEIAARLGYVDTSNFSRTVRRWFGATPREVREGKAPRVRMSKHERSWRFAGSATTSRSSAGPGAGGARAAWRCYKLSQRVHHLRRAQPSAAARAHGAAAPRRAAMRPAAPASPGRARPAPSDRAHGQDARRVRERAPAICDFIQQAMGRPQEGGKFYALLAWKRCDELGRHAAVAAAHTGNDAFHDGALALVADSRSAAPACSTPSPTLRRCTTLALRSAAASDFLMPPGAAASSRPRRARQPRLDLDAASAEVGRSPGRPPRCCAPTPVSSTWATATRRPGRRPPVARTGRGDVGL